MFIALLLLLFTGLAVAVLPARLRPLAHYASLAAAAASLALSVLGAGTRLFSDMPLPIFAVRPISSLICVGCAFYLTLTIVYSRRYAEFIRQPGRFYGYLLVCAAFSMSAALSRDLCALIVFWGLSGLMLFLLADLAPAAAASAKKALVFIGGTDALMILGAAIIWSRTGTTDMSAIHLALGGGPGIDTFAFLCLLCAALAKMGGFPFHTWVPDYARDVPLNISAFLPASLDKLLGIFLLLEITSRLFVPSHAMAVVLAVIAVITILAGAAMALVQNDARQLLAYSTISQVGYVIAGAACASPLGIVAALFHTVNHTLYKANLFFAAGAVEYRVGSTGFENGGLARKMPLTFAICLISSLAIAGVPPLNGFSSKWMTYQALFQRISLPGNDTATGIVFLIVLAGAFFGSALTLASFFKLLHSLFLGETPKKFQKEDAPREMLWPMALLASLCVIIGLFPGAVMVRSLLIPVLKDYGVLPSAALVPGPVAGPAMGLLFGGLIAGAAIVAAKRLRFSYRTDAPFTGGELLEENARASGADFYRTVSDMGLLRTFYRLAEEKAFDIYKQGARALLAAGCAVSRAHNGSLRTYLLYFLLGFAIMFGMVF